MIFSNFIYGLLIVINGLHPFYVSVSEVIFKEDAKSLQVMHRIFIDDFEGTLNRHYDRKLDILRMENTTSIDDIIQDYVENRFHVWVEGEKVDFNYLGSEVEKDVIWIYQEATEINKPSEVKIQCTFLFDEFETQSNLVHTTVDDELKTIRLIQDEDTGSVVFE
jgi:hypothetical protein